MTDSPAKARPMRRGREWADWLLLWESRACILALGIHFGLTLLWLFVLTGATFPVIYFVGEAARRGRE